MARQNALGGLLERVRDKLRESNLQMNENTGGFMEDDEWNTEPEIKPEQEGALESAVESVQSETKSKQGINVSEKPTVNTQHLAPKDPRPSVRKNQRGPPVRNKLKMQIGHTVVVVKGVFQAQMVFSL